MDTCYAIWVRQTGRLSSATEKDAYEKLQYDLYYIKNANPVMDFFILLQTLEVIIFGKGVR